jgi:hypothetical protein
VTRVDAAYDFKVGEPWSRLYELAVQVADHLPSGEKRERRISLTTIGDWLREDLGHPDGRTLYIGSMKSPVLARLYEKGKQMRRAFPDQADKYPSGWVRLELQVRPQKAARYAVAKLSVDELWGSSAWARQLHSAVFESELAKVVIAYQRPQDDARAWSFFLRQYGPMLRRRFDLAAAASPDLAPDELWRQIGSEIGHDLAEGEQAEGVEEATADDVRAKVAARRSAPQDAPYEGDRIGPDDHPGQHIDVGARAAAAIAAHGRAVAAPRKAAPVATGWDLLGPTPVL